MAANQTPIFPLTPHLAQVQATAANTARDGTGTTYTLFTPGANGSRIDHIDMWSAGTTAAGVLRFFLNDGTHTYLIHEIATAGHTVSGTTVDDNYQWIPLNGIIIQSGYTIVVSTVNAETWNFVAFGADY